MQRIAILQAVLLVISITSVLTAENRISGGGSLDQGSDACPATVIRMVPFHDSGNTDSLYNDFSTCSGMYGNDAIYEYIPAVSDSYSVTLCGSHFDTVLSIREGGACPGDTQVACNDDYCFLTSTINVRLLAGHTYYIIVDGYSSSSGWYQMTVTPWPVCPVSWWHRDSIEVSEYPIDSVFYQHDPTGGCSVDPPAFQWMRWGGLYADGLTGRSFTYYDDNGALRSDEDWYRFTVSEAETVRAAVKAGFPVHLEMLRLTSECDSISILSEETQVGCTLSTISRTCLGIGEYYLRVTCTADTLMTIPQLYRLTLSGSYPCHCDSVENLTAHLSPDHQHVWLHWNADTTGDQFTIYSTEDPNAPFSPADPWRWRTFHVAASAGLQCWIDPETTVMYSRFVAVRNCP